MIGRTDWLTDWLTDVMLCLHYKVGGYEIFVKCAGMIIIIIIIDWELKLRWPSWPSFLSPGDSETDHLQSPSHTSLYRQASHCHTVTLSHCHCVTVSLCHFVTLSHHSDHVSTNLTMFRVGTKKWSKSSIQRTEGYVIVNGCWCWTVWLWVTQ